MTLHCGPANGHLGKTGIYESPLITCRCCTWSMDLIFICDPRRYCNTERRGLYSAGRSPLSQQPLAVISVFFIDRPQNTLQKKYQSLPDKKAEAGKVLCLGHRLTSSRLKIGPRSPASQSNSVCYIAPPHYCKNCELISEHHQRLKTVRIWYMPKRMCRSGLGRGVRVKKQSHFEQLHEVQYKIV